MYRRNERTIRQYRDLAAPHLVERAPHEDRRKAAPGEARVDFRMGESETIPLEAIDSEPGKFATDVDLEPVSLGRVGHHGRCLRAGIRRGRGRRALEQGNQAPPWPIPPMTLHPLPAIVTAAAATSLSALPS